MNIITVDFETAYGGDLGFAKQTTEEYIRDERFEVIGVAVQVNDGEPVWFSGTHQKMYEFLNKYDWKNSLALAHNAIFDGAILNWQYGITPKGWLDTLSMGRALHGTNVGGSLAVLAQHYPERDEFRILTGAGVKHLRVLDRDRDGLLSFAVAMDERYEDAAGGGDEVPEPSLVGAASQDDLGRPLLLH